MPGLRGSKRAMPDVVSPTVRRRRLAAELRRLRVRADMTVGQVARQLKWSPSKVSRYELAQSGLKPEEVQRLLDLYGVASDRRQELLSLAHEAEQKGWWEEYSDVLHDEYIEIIGMEAEATSESSWHLGLVPGLLQTEAYARYVNGQGQAFELVPPGQLERSVQVRMKRQELLRRDPPLHFSAVIDESVLLRQIADPQTMRGQLKWLAEAAQLPSVSLRILKLNQRTPFMISPFDILRFGADSDTSLSDVVWVENLTTAVYFEDETESYRFGRVFELLFDKALSTADSIDLITRTAERVWG